MINYADPLGNQRPQSPSNAMQPLGPTASNARLSLGPNPQFATPQAMPGAGPSVAPQLFPSRSSINWADPLGYRQAVQRLNPPQAVRPPMRQPSAPVPPPQPAGPPPAYGMPVGTGGGVVFPSSGYLPPPPYPAPVPPPEAQNARQPLGPTPFDPRQQMNQANPGFGPGQAMPIPQFPGGGLGLPQQRGGDPNVGLPYDTRQVGPSPNVGLPQYPQPGRGGNPNVGLPYDTRQVGGNFDPGLGSGWPQQRGGDPNVGLSYDTRQVGGFDPRQQMNQVNPGFGPGQAMPPPQPVIGGMGGFQQQLSRQPYSGFDPRQSIRGGFDPRQQMNQPQGGGNDIMSMINRMSIPGQQGGNQMLAQLLMSMFGGRF